MKPSRERSRQSIGMIPIDREVHDGLFQRLLALAVFPPVGVGSCLLLRRPGLCRSGA